MTAARSSSRRAGTVAAVTLLLLALMALAAPPVHASPDAPSPAEISFSMHMQAPEPLANLVATDSFLSVDPLENELDAASEGLSSDAVFAELAALSRNEQAQMSADIMEMERDIEGLSAMDAELDAPSSLVESESQAEAEVDAEAEMEMEAEAEAEMEAEAEAGAEAEADSTADAAAQVEAEAEPLPAHDADARHFYRTTGGIPLHSGVDVWQLREERLVENAPLGMPLGVVLPGAQLVAERYAFANRRLEGQRVKALYAWGYLARDEANFGGWVGKSSCGWFPLQRRSESLHLHATIKEKRPNAKRRCPNPSQAQLDADDLFAADTFLLPSSSSYPKLAAAIAVKECSTYLNYDPRRQEALSAAPDMKEGLASGKGAFGRVPFGSDARITQRDGFGVRYVTADGQYALVALPKHDPRRAERVGTKYYFVRADCVNFDREAVRAMRESGGERDLLPNHSIPAGGSPANRPVVVPKSVTRLQIAVQKVKLAESKRLGEEKAREHERIMADKKAAAEAQQRRRERKKLREAARLHANTVVAQQSAEFAERSAKSAAKADAEHRKAIAQAHEQTEARIKAQADAKLAEELARKAEADKRTAALNARISQVNAQRLQAHANITAQVVGHNDNIDKANQRHLANYKAEIQRRKDEAQRLHAIQMERFNEQMKRRNMVEAARAKAEADRYQSIIDARKADLDRYNREFTAYQTALTARQKMDAQARAQLEAQIRAHADAAKRAQLEGVARVQGEAAARVQQEAQVRAQVEAQAAANQYQQQLAEQNAQNMARTAAEAEAARLAGVQAQQQATQQAGELLAQQQQAQAAQLASLQAAQEHAAQMAAMQQQAAPAAGGGGGGGGGIKDILGGMLSRVTANLNFGGGNGVSGGINLN